MTASLQVDVLAKQIKRGGWWRAVSTASFSCDWRPWPLSYYLARECSLAGDWTGHGFSKSGETGCNSMRVTNSIPKDWSSPTVQLCTTSTCGGFVICASGCDISTYRIGGRVLRLLSKMSCEKPVLAVTINAFSQKLVLAALLEGRIGLYIEMNGFLYQEFSNDQWESAGTLFNTAAASAPIMDFGEAYRLRSHEVTVGEFDELSVNAASFGETTFLHQSVEVCTHRRWADYLHAGRARLRGTRHVPRSENGIWPQSLTFGGSEEEKQSQNRVVPEIVYRNICFDDDPATSIAISPTRQCIAFGCKAGVELYWVPDTQHIICVCHHH